MEAMILAAGAGTRLSPLTNSVPKALVSVGDRPLMAWVMNRLLQAGVDRIVINTHYHESQIRAFVQGFAPPHLEVVFSPEPDGPLDTGGGLFRAAPLFRESEPFILHNVDVLSSISLKDLSVEHKAGSKGKGQRAVASLAVQKRDAKRRLLFDDLGLMGWENEGSDRAGQGRHQVREPVGKIQRWSFTGIHVVDPALFDLSDRTGKFSIITLYLELAAQGWNIQPIDVTGEEWLDVGTPKRLEKANRWVSNQR
jgi:NDP-sugar pyrophosphorylase family protein